MRTLALSFAAAILSLALLGAVQAASGTAVGVDPDAEARGSQPRTLVVGSDIFIGDRVVTGSSGLVQIIFSDETRLVVGPRSALLIEDYLLRENGSAGKFAINALSGSFRFITGDAPKDRYEITTPNGIIGVRGTVFDLYINERATYELLLHGATINCSNSGECEMLEAKCDYGILTDNEMQVVGDSRRELDAEELDRARGWFMHVVSQRHLLRPFRVSGAEVCLRRSTMMEAPESLSDPDDGPIRQPGRQGPGYTP